MTNGHKAKTEGAGVYDEGEQILVHVFQNSNFLKIVKECWNINHWTSQKLKLEIFQ
jgi:hypothetical protein